MGQNNMRAQHQGVNNIIGYQANNYHAALTTNNNADNRQAITKTHGDQQALPPPYEATKTADLNPLTTYFGFMTRPHDVILHAGKYVITDTYGGRIVALYPKNTYLVLYKAKSSYLPFRPFGIVALSDTKDSFLITDLDHNKGNGYVFKLEDDKLTPFSSTYKDFRTPTGITLNRNRDRVYIADSYYECILEFDVDGNFLGRRGKGSITEPWFIACNSKDNIYVTDKEGIKVFLPNWEYFTTVTIDTLGKTWCYRGIAIDNNDNIFITARSRDSVLMFTKETVAVMNARHELVKDCIGGITRHNYLRGVCIDYDMNRVVVVNGERHLIATYTLYNK